ncbi:MAG: metalloregulator ArsR/SmtB family transcription factor [Verrucomicrobia bacterium]|nr:metalloregulator ArsR/SmtB family transcription factor [Verrucomicrobiota bacterium]
MITAIEILKLLADVTRLRIVNLLAQEELSVAELQEILDMGQSRISSHLALLRQGGLVLDRREGKRTYYSLTHRKGSSDQTLLDTILSSTSTDAELQQDGAALKRVIDSRRQLSERYFNEVAGRLGKNYCPGRSWEAIGHLLLKLVPEIDIVDLGAGEGVLSQLLARRARSVYCIDNSPKMVEVGTQLAKEHGFENLHYTLGDIEQVPLQDNSMDLALLSQALHHAQHPRKAIQEAWRVLRPGGELLILDLNEHTFEKARELYADLWLGFKSNTLYRWLSESGFHRVNVDIVAKETHPPHFETILAQGTKI